MIEHRGNLARFKALLRANKRAPELARATLRKTAIGKSADAGSRRIKFTLSTSTVDLDNDTVNQAGWDLSVFRTNPIGLWMHDDSQLPIAKWDNVAPEGGRLRGVAEFVPASVPVVGPFAEAVYQMCRSGFLSAISVGFVPREFEIANDRDDDSFLPPVNFRKQLLLEASFVTVPANSEALIDPSERDGAVMPPASASRALMAAAAKHQVDEAFRRARLMARVL